MFRRRGGAALGGKLINKAIARDRSRQLQLASGGHYKFYLLSKIVSFLKTQFLDVKEKRLPLEKLLEELGEFQVSDDILKWLNEEGLPKNPRIRVCDLVNEIRYAYQPPLACRTQSALLKVLKHKHTESEGGLLQRLVEDSMSNAERSISNLLEENQIIQIARLDNEKVLFFKAPEPELDKCPMDDRFVELWRRIDVSNKEMDHLKTYLKNQHISIFDDEAYETRGNPPVVAKRKPPAPKLRRSKRKLVVRDNAHVQQDLDMSLRDMEMA